MPKKSNMGSSIQDDKDNLEIKPVKVSKEVIAEEKVKAKAAKAEEKAKTLAEEKAKNKAAKAEAKEAKDKEHNDTILKNKYLTLFEFNDDKIISNDIVLKQYNIIEGFDYFNETINYVKLKYIIDNWKYFKNFVMKDVDNSVRLKKYPHMKTAKGFFNYLKKIYNSLDFKNTDNNSEYATLKVQYKKSKSSDIGREYCIDGIGIQFMIGIIRHTVCDDWDDIDMVNAHPHILQLLFNKHNLSSPMLDDNVYNRESFLMKIHKDRAKAKNLVLSMLYGADTSSNVYLTRFCNELKPLLDIIVNLPEYKAIYDNIKSNEKFNIIGKTISRIIQNIENDILTAYVRFCKNKGFLENRELALIFDGFQVKSKYNLANDDALLRECEQFAYKETGYLINLKPKPFDNPLNLPANYADCVFKDTIDTFTDMILSKINDEFIDDNVDLINECIEDRTHTAIAELISRALKDRMYYDNICKCYYHCSTRNIWKESDSPILLEHVITKVGIYAIKKVLRKDILTALDPKTDSDVRARLLKKAEKAEKLYLLLGNVPFRKHISSIKTYYMKDNFKSDFLNSNHHLLAFTNKVFDFSLKINKPNSELKIEDFIRNIQPDDYILNNIGYLFPETDDADSLTFLNNYFSELFPVYTKKEINDKGEEYDSKKNIGKKEYVLKILATSLNGANKEQSIFLYTGQNGAGSNGKSVYLKFIEDLLGGYYADLSPGTFTEKEKVNSNGEIWRVEGKRYVSFQEPATEVGACLQTPILKKFGDTNDVKITAKLYNQQEYKFSNQSTVHGAMNHKPSLSDIDGGIERRIKVIVWEVIFNEDYKDSDDPLKRYKDTNVSNRLKDPKVITTFIRMLLKLWINDIKDVQQIKVPECVIEASKDYCDDNNSVSKFINSKYIITKSPENMVQSSILFSDYKSFMKNTSSDIALGDKKFKEQVLLLANVKYLKINGLIQVLYITSRFDYELKLKIAAKEAKDAKNDTFHDDTEPDDIDIDEKLLNKNLKAAGIYNNTGAKETKKPKMDDSDSDSDMDAAINKLRESSSLPKNKYCISRTQDKSF
jgi:P4 family phage/plasmid primase-like protien